MRTSTSRPLEAPVGPPAGLPPDPSVIPEFFGDTMLVNGTVYPDVDVEPRQYRLRMLNACNARFLNPRLVYAQGQTRRHRRPRRNTTRRARPSSRSAPRAASCPHPACSSTGRQAAPCSCWQPAERADLDRGLPRCSRRGLRRSSSTTTRPAPFPGGRSRVTTTTREPGDARVDPGIRPEHADASPDPVKRGDS